mmetsp:Transcript_10776/g.32337  ORF Transcript_10776/g.32337 Transcript_10776/m.32337 type:complete len:263 (-) Transcript_10776:1027-1815(-)
MSTKLVDALLQPRLVVSIMSSMPSRARQCRGVCIDFPAGDPTGHRAMLGGGFTTRRPAAIWVACSALAVRRPLAGSSLVSCTTRCPSGIGAGVILTIFAGGPARRPLAVGGFFCGFASGRPANAGATGAGLATGIPSVAGIVVTLAAAGLPLTSRYVWVVSAVARAPIGTGAAFSSLAGWRPLAGDSLVSCASRCGPESGKRLFLTGSAVQAAWHPPLVGFVAGRPTNNGPPWAPFSARSLVAARDGFTVSAVGLPSASKCV